VPGGVGLKISLYFTEVLNSLGLKATHKAFSNIDRYFDRLYSEKPQIGLAAWGPDCPAPSNFIDFLLSCEGPTNSTGLCDADIDRMIDRALELQTVDPPRAQELWGDIERRIVDLAPWVSVVNPVSLDVISARVGNYQRHPQWGLLVDQLWVK
jgi:ABC-type transport system substrate-binding protein